MKKFWVFCLVVALIGGLVYGGYYLYNNTDLLDHFFVKEGTEDKEETERTETTYTVNFECNGGSTIDPQTVENGKNIEHPGIPSREGFAFVGWYTSNNFEELFDFSQPIKKSCTVYAHWVDTTDTTDTDGDGLTDPVEEYYGTDSNKVDTDNDSLSDYQEIAIFNLDPLKKDTNGNGIDDGDEDSDGDSLPNLTELSLGTNPMTKDTDGDVLLDSDELNTYGTNPIILDTDGDGASDGWEVENGFNPLRMDETFALTIASEADDLTVGVNVNVDGQTAEGITIEPTVNSFLLSNTIPGALSPAYDFYTPGELGAVELFFMPAEEILSNDQIIPTIYCLNEEKQVFYEMETSIHNGIVQTVTTHFSTYILLDKNVYEAYVKATYNVDYSQDSGVDSNNDGISDYLTKLMCDGVIRTGTGALVFGDYTYEEIQANNDIDGDGIKNGDEIYCDHKIEIPDDAVEYNGHYYKVFDTGDFCVSAQSYCESIGGYLCTITSQGEQDFVLSLLNNPGKNVYWLGGTKVNKQWGWITGEGFSYTNWGPGEPNNMEGSENYLQVYAVAYRQKIAGDWNDASNVGAEYSSDFYSVSNTGFICEWGSFDVNSHKYAFVNSSPIHSDTDGDGIQDNEDSARLVKGLEDGLVGKLTLVTCYNTEDSSWTSGHTFLVYTSYINDNINFSSLATGWSKKDIAKEWSWNNLVRDCSASSSYYISVGDSVTIGNGAFGTGWFGIGDGLGSLGNSADVSGESNESGAGEENGVCYNMELYKHLSPDIGYSYLNNTCLSKEMTEEELETLIAFLSQDTENYWNLIHNCAEVACKAWNMISDIDVNPYHDDFMFGNIATPKGLKINLRMLPNSFENYVLADAFNQ